jgi:hypothetical protein
MAKRKYTEVEMIGALRQIEAGRTAAEVRREWAFPSTPCTPGQPTTEG